MLKETESQEEKRLPNTHKSSPIFGDPFGVKKTGLRHKRIVKKNVMSFKVKLSLVIVAYFTYKPV